MGSFNRTNHKFQVCITKDYAALEVIYQGLMRDLEDLTLSLQKFESEFILKIGTKYLYLDSLYTESLKILTGDQIQDKGLRRSDSPAPVIQLKNAAAPGKAAEVKEFYQKIVLKIHPDVAWADSERESFHHIMTEVNRAYRNGDSLLLLNILKKLGIINQSFKPLIISEQTPIHNIFQLKNRIQNITEYIHTLKNSKISELKAIIARDGQGLLKRLELKIGREISQAKQYLIRLKQGRQILLKKERDREIIREFFLKHFEDIFSRGLRDIKELLNQKQQPSGSAATAKIYSFQGKADSLIKAYYKQILEFENDEMIHDVIMELQKKKEILYQKNWIV